MKILLLAPSYLNLYKPIEDELIKQGHSVYTIEDKEFKYDSYHKRDNCLKRWIKAIFFLLFSNPQKYWDNIYNNIEQIRDGFDFLFVINGCSFDPYLLELLRRDNPKIKTCLYLWDTNRFYDYFRNVRYFDKVLTFDYEDSRKLGSNTFLPFYWIHSNDDKKYCKEYDISIIGTNHDGRYELLSTIKPQLDKFNVKYLFKVCQLIQKKPRLFPLMKIKLLLMKREDILLWWKIALGQIEDDLISRTYYTIDEINSIMLKSKCILDTDRESQTGTTPRVIWALALGKKIISTNTNLKKMPFFDEKQIMIIDRINPQININFIKEDIKFETNDYIFNLRIDKWVKRILDV